MLSVTDKTNYNISEHGNVEILRKQTHESQWNELHKIRAVSTGVIGNRQSVCDRLALGLTVTVWYSSDAPVDLNVLDCIDCSVEMVSPTSDTVVSRRHRVTFIPKFHMVHVEFCYTPLFPLCPVSLDCGIVSFATMRYS